MLSDVEGIVLTKFDHWPWVSHGLYKTLLGNLGIYSSVFVHVSVSESRKIAVLWSSKIHATTLLVFCSGVWHGERSSVQCVCSFCMGHHV